MDVIIQRSMEEITAIDVIKGKVDQYAELVTLLQKERNRLTRDPRYRYMGGLYMLWLIRKWYTVIPDDHNELRLMEETQRLNL